MTASSAVAPAENGHSSDKQQWLPHPPSVISQRTINPIRRIVDRLKIPTNLTHLPLIPLSLGDPTVFKNFLPPSNLIDSIIANLRSATANGYAPSTGLIQARQAIADRYTSAASPLTPADICITSGASGALSIVIQALANAGDNILVPRPGFSLYQTICQHDGIEPLYYNLLPDRSWEVDAEHLESLIDSHTRAILINNPGNPTGSNYSIEHLQKLLDIAERHHLIIIADEIYENMVFTGETFTALGELSVNVPILTITGIAKQYCVPGWRIGWIIIHDRHGILRDIRTAIESLSQLIIGGNTLIQSALPDLLHHTEPSYYSDFLSTLEQHATLLVQRLEQIPCLHVVRPQGAMYVMCRIRLETLQPTITNDTDFSAQLLAEQNVIVLPGSCFMADDYIRLVFCAPKHILSDACDRIEKFYQQHKRGGMNGHSESDKSPVELKTNGTAQYEPSDEY